MIAADHTVIDPTPQELDALLDNLPRTPELAAALAGPEGWWTWSSVDEGRPLRETESSTHLAWWSDYLGRRHVRVVRLQVHTRSERIEALAAPETFPLLRVYPRAGYEVWRGRGYDAVLVVCPCGAFGTPAEVAWMGTECGPCHDRRAAGELPARPWEQGCREVPGYGRVDGLTLHPTRPLLAVQSGVGRLWDFADAEPGVVRTLDGTGLAWSPDGEWVAVGGDGAACVLRGDTLDPVTTLGVPAYALGFSPSGRWLVGLNWEPGVCTLYVWDFARWGPARRVFSHSHLHWAFAQDETALYSANYRGQIHRYDLEAGTSDILDCPFPDGDEGGPLWCLHAGPDEDTLVLGEEGTFYLLDRHTGAVRHREHVALFNDASPVLQAPDRRCLVGFHPERRQMHFLSLPGFDRPRTLAWYGAAAERVAASADWLALAGGGRVRVAPWRPLLDWYAKETAR